MLSDAAIFYLIVHSCRVDFSYLSPYQLTSQKSPAILFYSSSEGL